MVIDKKLNTDKRHKWNSTSRASLLALSLAVMVSACSKNADIDTYIEPTVPADQLYNEALANIDAGDTSQAKRKLKKLDRQHPYSKYAKKSGVMSTYLAYKSGEFGEAIAQGKRFVALYPANKEAPYALYLVGMSYHRQMADVTRDQKVAKKSYNTFNDLVQRYPDSEYVEDSKRKMRIAFDQLAGKEMLVGRYYQERSEYLAAINRYRVVVEKYENTRHIEEALARLTETYYALGLTSEAQTAAAVLGHNFPESQWYKDSYALLEKGGLRPLENQGSWISRAARTIVGVPS